MLNLEGSAQIGSFETIRKRRIKWLRLGISLALALSLAIWAFYTGLTVREYTVISEKVASGSVRIVQVSDLHSHIYGDDQQPLIELIKAQRPDIIALTGDILDDEETDDGAVLLLEGIQGIAPIYYVSGNHEYWSDRYDEIKAMIESYGVVVLDNEWEELTVNGVTLRLCGVDDPMLFVSTSAPEYLALSDGSENEHDNMRALLADRFNDLDDSVYTVLLAHRPELIDLYRQYNFDLILSGHTHGGQIRIPLLLNGLFAPNQRFFPKYGGGRYDFEDGKTLVVNCGLSFNQYIPRVFNPPEVVTVDVAGNR